MRIELRLDYPGKYTWSENEGIHFIGYAFDDQQRLYRTAGDWSKENFETAIEQVKGCFAAILLKKNEIKVWTDTAASFPLFYTIKDQALQIACTPQPAGQLSFSPEAVASLAKIYCTQGSETLLPGWKTIPAGHVLIVDIPGNNTRLQRYFDHFISEKTPRTTAFNQQFLEITHQWAEQIARFAEGRPIWIPLSGGYDSRLLLSILIQAQVPNLHAYTYGKEFSPEVHTAHKVAKQLKIDWHFIPYLDKAFQYFFTEAWEQYALHNHHYQSLPHEQDFFALFALSQKGVLSEDFVVIPGYCGDIAGGSFLKNYPIRTGDYILQKHGLTTDKFEQHIDPWDSYQQWLSENRLSKFIVNSVRLFEYFGGQWMLPMWHRDFLHLFYALPHEARWEEKTYLDLAFRHYFIPLEIDFRKDRSDAPVAGLTWKDKVKEILPASFTRRIQKINGQRAAADPCNIRTLYNMLYREMKFQRLPLPEKDYNFNRLHVCYLLEIIKKAQ